MSPDSARKEKDPAEFDRKISVLFTLTTPVIPDCTVRNPAIGVAEPCATPDVSMGSGVV